jgi:hypothetical protein
MGKQSALKTRKTAPATTATARQFHQHTDAMRHSGFEKVSEEKGPNPANASRMSILNSKWSHPTIGMVHIDHLAHTFLHEGATESHQPAGKNNVLLDAYLQNLLTSVGTAAKRRTKTGEIVPVISGSDETTLTGGVEQ